MSRVFVPMLSIQKSEIRAFALDAIYETDTEGGYQLDDYHGAPWTLALPPNMTSLDEVPRFTTAAACFAHISEQWPLLQA